MTTKSRAIIGGSVALAVIYLLFWAWPRSDAKNAFHYRQFGLIPAVQGGRYMPLDTFARISLMAMSHRQTLKEFKNPDNVKDGYTMEPAVKWLLDNLTSPPPIPNEASPDHSLVRLLHLAFEPGERGGPAYDQRVFRIENDEVLGLLGLESRPELRYSFNEIRSNNNFENFLARAKHFIRDPDDPRPAPKPETIADIKTLELYHNLHSMLGLNTLKGPLMIPKDAKGEDWDSVARSLLAGMRAKDPDPATQSLFTMLLAYRKGDVQEFNKAVDSYHNFLQKEMPEVANSVWLETYFNGFAPFYHSAVIYGFLFVLVCLSWMTRSESLRSAAFWTTLLVLLVHTWALCIRMYITARPPVTNLYSSAVFIGWGCVVTCCVIEWFYKNGLALSVGAITGGLSLIVAHILGLSGETMEVLQAVLDTNFWLATHVTCITLGYTATFVAGFMGILYIVLGRFTNVLSDNSSTYFDTRDPNDPLNIRRDETIGVMLGKMMYGVLCFAMFLSFTGTVLGGIWADQSWGRFWGWDPKENGALLIVIWVALILHARWGGMIKQRGIAVLAVLGNCVTAWSWFGTNLLGVGLHSYGFMAGAMTSIVVFDLAMIAIALVGLAPLAKWRSFAHAKAV